MPQASESDKRTCSATPKHTDKIQILPGSDTHEYIYELMTEQIIFCKLSLPMKGRRRTTINGNQVNRHPC